MKWTKELFTDVVSDVLNVKYHATEEQIREVGNHIRDILINQDGISIVEMQNLASKLWELSTSGSTPVSIEDIANLNEEKQSVIELAKHDGFADNKKVRRLLSCSDSKATVVLSDLVQRGFLTRVGQGRGSRCIPASATASMNRNRFTEPSDEYKVLMTKYTHAEDLLKQLRSENEYLKTQLTASNNACTDLSSKLNTLEEEINRLKQTQNADTDISHWSERVSNLCESLFSDNNTAKKFLTIAAMKKAMTKEQFDISELINSNMRLLLTVGYLLMNQNKQYIPTILQDQLQMQLTALSSVAPHKQNNVRMTMLRQEILKFINEHKYASRQQVINQLHISPTTAHDILESLRTEGEIFASSDSGSTRILYLSLDYKKSRDELLKQENRIPVAGGQTCSLETGPLGILSKATVHELFAQTFLNEAYSQRYNTKGKVSAACFANFIESNMCDVGLVHIRIDGWTNLLRNVLANFRDSLRKATSSNVMLLWLLLQDRYDYYNKEADRTGIIALCKPDSYGMLKNWCLSTSTIRHLSEIDLCREFRSGVEVGRIARPDYPNPNTISQLLRSKGIVRYVDDPNSSSRIFTCHFDKKFIDVLPHLRVLVDTAEASELVDLSAFLNQHS